MPAEPFTPPFDADQLGKILKALKGWTLVDASHAFNDLDRALGAQTPTPHELPELVHGLRDTLQRLITIAVAHSSPDEEQVSAAAERARELLDDERTGRVRQLSRRALGQRYSADLGLARRLARRPAPCWSC
ncbi:hypothetical protein ACIG3E_33505 [Streptomyces sp. NPDC053474]|uniref:hypothetical protein n=1 Tax=Streptomyces sp. NPDC053474 TaxID=3365704 RepID=UPI0037D46918